MLYESAFDTDMHTRPRSILHSSEREIIILIN